MTQTHLVSPFGSPDISLVEPSHIQEADLKNAVVHLLDNGKWNANYLFSGIEAGLAGRILRVERSKKFHYSVVADASSVADVAVSADLVVTGVGDCGSCTSCSVHDTVELERAGIPTVLVATNNFMAESRLQADLLGMVGMRVIEIEHPIASRTRDYMEALGNGIAEQCISLLTQVRQPPELS